MGKRRKSMKTLNRLEERLLEVHMDGIMQFFEDNKEDFIDDEYAFAKYMRLKFKEKGVSQQDVFLYADIPERYGYKLISLQKRTKQRDIILRICYSAKFTIEETQMALRLYDMPELHAEFPRDAMIMVVLKDRPGDIIEVNTLLRGNGVKPLRSSGTMD